MFFIYSYYPFDDWLHVTIAEDSQYSTRYFRKVENQHKVQYKATKLKYKLQ